MGKRKFWNWVRDSDTGERTLVLNGTIAEDSWFGDEVTPAIFQDELTKGDPACGNFGFMIAAHSYVRRHTDDFFDLDADVAEFERKEAFTGCELVH